MPLTIAALVLASAILHPLWNMLVKKDPQPEGAMLVITFSLGTTGLVHSLIIGADLLAMLPIAHLLVLSCLGQILYGTSLIATLKRGDLSAYYPIIRASPVFVVTVGFLFLDQTYPASLLLGIAMVIGGAALLLYRKGTNLLSDPVTLLLAILAMCGTGLYSLADAAIMREVEPPVLFFWVELFCFPYYVILYRRLGRSLPPYFGLGKFVSDPFRTLRLVALVYGSYYLLLTAYELGGDVAAVTAVRQASIPLSVILGGYFLREGSIGRRLVGSLVLALGIVLIVVMK